MKVLTLALCLLISGGLLRSKSTYFHLMELNHFYSLDGKYVYSQIILWHRDPVTYKLEVGEWAIVDGYYNADFPSHNNGLHHWTSKEGLNAHSRLFRESWTQTDPERANQRKLHPEDRIGLPRLVKP